MKYLGKNTGWRSVLSATALTVVSLGGTSLVPAFADPPDHAPAHGWRRKQEDKRDDRDDRERRDRDYRDVFDILRRNNDRDRDDRDNRDRKDRKKRDKREDGRRRERDKHRTGWEKERDRNDRWSSPIGHSTTAWANRDSDGDGFRNGRDRYPLDPKRH